MVKTTGASQSLGQQAVPVRFFLRRQVRVMLKNHPVQVSAVRVAVLQNLPDCVGILVDNRSVRDDVEDSLQLMVGSVAEGKPKAGERLATARRNG